MSVVPAQTLWNSLRKHLNFFRVHVLFFTITPLIFSGIFYASNGRFHISYIDSLYNCVSAMTVCGLATVNLSSLTGWQQTILFIQMCLGSPVLVSWVMVYVRRHYFAKKFNHIVSAEMAARAAQKLQDDSVEPVRTWPRRFTTIFRRRTGLSTVVEVTEEDQPRNEVRRGGIIRKLRPDMIRRMDDAPRPVDPNGWISEEQSVPIKRMSMAHSNHFAEEPSVPISSSPVEQVPEKDDPVEQQTTRPVNRRLSHVRRVSDPGPSNSISNTNPMHRYETMNVDIQNQDTSTMPRTTTVEFALADPGRRERPQVSGSDRSGAESLYADDRRSARRSSLAQSQRPTRLSKHSGYGGFPMPHEILSSIFRRLFPKLERKLTRSLTYPATTTIASQHPGGASNLDGSKVVPYISFDAIVGRNSTFHLLTNEQLEELGGVEYRALNALLYIVAGYHIGIQLLAFAIIAPYMSLNKWKKDFQVPMQLRNVPSPWFSLFQCVSAYTNTGTSLVDQSMVPFQTAYPTIVCMIFLILAGNTAFPVFLRFLIWILTKLVPKQSRTNETLHFLLDHPRRCFIYLFPSHQTWFLVTILIILNFTDWFFFMVLDIGNPAIDYIPLGVRFIIGLLQAVAVRAAGFGLVPLSALAPAVKVLYAVMMYISVYPIALSVRSTNVYEEQSLGIFRDEEEEEEHGFQAVGPRITVWSRYLAMHARRQLAFDMWWLAFALFLVCIIERGALDDIANQGWFNIFNIIFELVSAYGTVGLSLGIPTQNYSLSGAFRPLSKLIVCLVMLRGRHRGLPVAIDRAVLLPQEYHKHEDIGDDDGRSTRKQAERSQPPRAPTPNSNASNTSNEKRSSLEDGKRYMKSELSVQNSRRRSYMEDSEMAS